LKPLHINAKIGVLIDDLFKEERLVMDVSFSVILVAHSPTPTRSTMMIKQISFMVKEM
jgi:hypothetical protein